MLSVCKSFGFSLCRLCICIFACLSCVSPRGSVVLYYYTYVDTEEGQKADEVGMIRTIHPQNTSAFSKLKKFKNIK